MNLERNSGPSSPEFCLEPEPGEPILFVNSNREGKLHMCDWAVKMLQSMEDPVAIVSVCGRVQSGKSFLLNQLLGRSDGFKVESSRYGCCTVALYLWSSPLWRTTSDGTSYDILFMDTEAIDTKDICSIRTVSLAVLLSSMVIYNQMGSIDDVALHLLSCVIEMSELIHEASVLKKYSPILLWLLRDFDLGMVEDNHVVTPRDYLEHSLGRVEHVGGSTAVAINKIRKSIQAFFPDRECFTIASPVVDKNDLGRLDQIALERLRPEFRAGLAILKRYILEMTRPKQVGEILMTGPMLVRITQMYIDALNIGRTETSALSNVEGVCLSAYDSGERYFKRIVGSLKSNVPKSFLENKLAFAMSLFDTEFYSFTEPLLFREVYRRCLKSALEKKIEEYYGNRRKLQPEGIANGNLSNNCEDAAVGKFIGCLGTSGLGVGSVLTHCRAQSQQKLLSFGLQLRRKKSDTHSQKEFIGGGRIDGDDMDFDSPHHMSAYETATGEGLKMKAS